MSNTVHHADLVARALNALPEDERARIDRALESDEALRLQFEEIAGHLLQYDALADAPPPPPFARIADRMDADEAPDLRILQLHETGGGRWIPYAAVAAAAVMAFVFFLLPLSQGRQVQPATITRGAGMELTLRRGGPELSCEQTAEAQLGTRARVVMAGGSTLAVSTEHRVDLLAGRAWFEVRPHEQEFAVFTRFGRVVVLGTSFEVDVRGAELRVSVAEGRVGALGKLIGAGSNLVAGTVKPSTTAPGAWFRMPTLSLEARGANPPTAGKPVELAVVFANPGHVPMRLEGPDSARTPIWLRFETQAGRVLRELPLLASNVVSGLELLEPRGSVVLEGGSRAVLAVRILPPFASSGAYRCTALYRPEGQAPVLSSPLEFEVR